MNVFELKIKISFHWHYGFQLFTMLDILFVFLLRETMKSLIQWEKLFHLNWKDELLLEMKFSSKWFSTDREMKSKQEITYSQQCILQNQVWQTLNYILKYLFIHVGSINSKTIFNSSWTFVWTQRISNLFKANSN